MKSIHTFFYNIYFRKLSNYLKFIQTLKILFTDDIWESRVVRIQLAEN